MRRAIRACDLPALQREAELIRAAAPRGSDTWFEASGALVRVHHRRFDPTQLEIIARDALAAATELRRSEPAATRSAPGPSSPFAAARVIEMETLLARVLQSRGLH